MTDALGQKNTSFFSFSLPRVIHEIGFFTQAFSKIKKLITDVWVENSQAEVGGFTLLKALQYLFG
jgi:hypothetical protein